MGMFDFLFMEGNYEERKVKNDVVGNGVVDTCYVNDGKQPYETAIKHPFYNQGNWIAVAAYDTIEEAEVGHGKWVEIMSNLELPEYLVEIRNAEIAEFALNEEDCIFRKEEMG